MESGTWEGATEPVFSTSCLCQEQMRLCREELMVLLQVPACPALLQEDKPPGICTDPSGSVCCHWLTLLALPGREGKAFCFVLG